jgi:hypothetical protein
MSCEKHRREAVAQRFDVAELAHQALDAEEDLGLARASDADLVGQLARGLGHAVAQRRVAGELHDLGRVEDAGLLARQPGRELNAHAALRKHAVLFLDRP